MYIFRRICLLLHRGIWFLFFLDMFTSFWLNWSLCWWWLMRNCFCKGWHLHLFIWLYCVGLGYLTGREFIIWNWRVLRRTQTVPYCSPDDCGFFVIQLFKCRHKYSQVNPSVKRLIVLKCYFIRFVFRVHAKKNKE